MPPARIAARQRPSAISRTVSASSRTIASRPVEFNAPSGVLGAIPAARHIESHMSGLKPETAPRSRLETVWPAAVPSPAVPSAAVSASGASILLIAVSSSPSGANLS